MSKIPERCKPCVRLHTGGMPGTKHEIWCTAHSMPAKKADPHCRTGGGNDKRDLVHWFDK